MVLSNITIKYQIQLDLLIDVGKGGLLICVR